MRLAVVIPAYNRPTLLLESLASVAAQTRSPDRVVVVDDVSTDDTAERAEQWMHGRDGWEVLRSTTNTGPGPARNRGVARVDDCDAVAFLDCDDLWPPDFLHRVEQAFRRAPEVGALAADYQEYRPKLPKEGVRIVNEWVETRPVYGFIRLGGITPSASAVRLEAFHAVDGFDPELRLNEDMEFFLRLSLTTRWAHLPGTPIEYRQDVSEQRDEAPSLILSSRGGPERRVFILERFAGIGGAPRIDRHLGWARYRAARQALREGRRSDARRHCAKAFRYAPWYPRPWFCYLRSFLPGTAEK
ncbi:MAG: glycosyltransferase family A protein [Planctomycetota bacterium]